MYYEQVKRYIEVFGKNNVKIIFTEDMKKNASAVIREVYEFIGVDAAFVADTSKQYNEVYTPKYKNLTWFLNKTGIRPIMKKFSPRVVKNMIVKMLYKGKSDKGEIPVEAKTFLKEKLSGDIQQLSILLNKDLSNWLK